jgi:hypothetical protein
MKQTLIPLTALKFVPIDFPDACKARSERLAQALLDSRTLPEVSDMLIPATVIKIGGSWMACDFYLLLKALQRHVPNLQLHFFIHKVTDIDQAFETIAQRIALSAVSTINAVEVPSFEVAVKAANSSYSALFGRTSWARTLGANRTTLNHHDKKFKERSLTVCNEPDSLDLKTIVDRVPPRPREQ